MFRCYFLEMSQGGKQSSVKRGKIELKPKIRLSRYAKLTD